MKTLKTFEFKEFGGASEYDWERLLDGQIYQLESGKDYTCKNTTMGTLARNAARRVGKIVKTGVVDNGIVLQAIPASKEQLKAWAAADAKKKAEKKAENGDQ